MGYPFGQLSKRIVVAIASLMPAIALGADVPAPHVTVDFKDPAALKLHSDQSLLADPFFQQLQPVFGRGVNLGNALEVRAGATGVYRWKGNIFH